MGVSPRLKGRLTTPAINIDPIAIQVKAVLVIKPIPWVQLMLGPELRAEIIRRAKNSTKHIKIIPYIIENEDARIPTPTEIISPRGLGDTRIKWFYDKNSELRHQ